MGLHGAREARVRREGTPHEYGTYRLANIQEGWENFPELVSHVQDTLRQELEDSFRENGHVPDWSTLTFETRRAWAVDLALDHLAENRYYIGAKVVAYSDNMLVTYVDERSAVFSVEQ